MVCQAHAFGGQAVGMGQRSKSKKGNAKLDIKDTNHAVEINDATLDVFSSKHG